MGLAHSPRIVTDGLVLCLDAGNTKSYGGSGTTWNDLKSRSYDATLSTTYSHTAFSGSSPGYFTFSGNGVATTSSFSLTYVSWEVFYRSSSNDSFTTYGRILDWSDTTISLGSFNTYQLRMWTNAGGSRSSESVKNGIGTDGLWHHVIYTYDGSQTKFYLDGTLEQTVNKTGSLNNGSAAALTIGDGDAYVFGGDISLVRVYNKALSAAEVAQNFNALRGRYGI